MRIDICPIIQSNKKAVYQRAHFGVNGIEKASKFMMPALFIILVIIIIRGITLPGAGKGLAFIFSSRFDAFIITSISAALGQVFYSLSICMGITITYGSYLDRDINIPRSCINIAVLDTVIAILAGIAIFATLFFLLIFFAAMTSAAALLEVCASFDVGTWHWSRKKAVLLLTTAIFLLGIPSSLSFGPLADISTSTPTEI